MAVYTHLSSGEVARIAAGYGLGLPVEAHPIAKGVENSNYRLDEADGTRRILTVYEQRTRAEDVPFFLDLTRHLAEKGLPVPRPLPTVKGQATVLTEGGKTAAIVEFLPGEEVSEITDAQCGEVGAMLARLHDAVADFQQTRVNDLSLEGWCGLAGRNAGRLDSLAAGLRDEITSELDFLTRHWPRDLSEGVVHLDLFPDNVFFKGDRLTGVIDFYFAATDFFLYDLAIAVNAWCFEQGVFQPRRAGSMTGAYHASRPLTPPGQAAWPVLLRGAALRFLLTRAHDALNQQPGALVSVKDPLEYRAILRHWRMA